MNPIARSWALITALVVAGTPLLQANPTNLNISAAQDFNLLTWQNAALSNSDIEGRVAAGGSVTFNSYSIGTDAAITNPLTGALIVGGALTAGNGQVFKGSIYVGGAYSGPGYPLNSAAGSVTQSGLGAGIPFNFSSAETSLSLTSGTYGAATPTGSSLLQFSTLTLTGTSAGLNIFDISGTDLAAASDLSINAPAGSQVLINVSGTTDTFSNKGIDGTFVSTAGADSNILYNFYQATSLSMSGIGIDGSVLAPLANVSFASGQLDGQLIANSFTGSGELHEDPFNNQTGSVPDAASTAVLLLGAIIAGAAFRRLRFPAGNDLA